MLGNTHSLESAYLSVDSRKGCEKIVYSFSTNNSKFKTLWEIVGDHISDLVDDFCYKSGSQKCPNSFFC